MYRVFEILAAAALLGLFVLVLRRLRRPATRLLLPPVSLLALLLAALCWHAIAVALSGAAPAVPGWYLAPALAAELILFGWGFASLLGPRAATASLCLLAALSAALDVYSTAFLLAPHYSGLKPAHAAFPWRAYLDPAQFAEMLRRLTLFDDPLLTPSALAALWAAYLAATLLLFAFSLRLAYSAISAPRPRSFSTSRS